MAINLENKNTEQDTAIAGKVAIDQGVANAGKALVVGEDGNVAPAEVSGGKTLYTGPISDFFEITDYTVEVKRDFEIEYIFTSGNYSLIRSGSSFVPKQSIKYIYSSTYPRGDFVLGVNGDVDFTSSASLSCINIAIDKTNSNFPILSVSVTGNTSSTQITSSTLSFARSTTLRGYRLWVY